MMKMDKQHLTLKWSLEMVAFLITGILTALILMPIILNVPNYVFLFYNSAIIFIFFTLIRYVFLLKLTPFARFSPVKVVFIFIALPLIIFLTDGLTEFQYFLDENGAYGLVEHLNIKKQIPLSKYIKSEMLFFAVGSIIVTAILPVRMIISLWRVKNRNTI